MSRGRNNNASWFNLDFYQRLNIKRNADQDLIETAYAKMALKHHPDVAGDSPVVQERFAGINEAYTVLSKPLKREDYDAKLVTPEVDYQEEVITTDEGRGAAESVPDPAPHVSVERTGKVAETAKTAKTASDLMGRKKLERVKRESKKLIHNGDFWRANALMRKAVLAYPRDIELRKLLAKAAAGRGRLREAVEELKIASEVEYFNPEIHYLIGDMYLKGNRIEKAESSFRNALSWQEDFRPALEGLKKIRAMRIKDLPWWKKVLRKG